MERLHCMLNDLLTSACRLLVPTMFVGVILAGSIVTAQEQVAEPTPRVAEKRIIGPTTMIAEANSELDFKARVDTGAMTTSVHVEEWAIEDESAKMEDNLGKKIRFRMSNHKGESQWVESRIEEVAVVKTAQHQAPRYKVQLTLRWNDVKKEVLVTLNDRSHMRYPLLLGRNFLEGDFVVDVAPHKQPQSEAVPSEDTAAAEGK
jgi:hypothetical protein